MSSQLPTLSDGINLLETDANTAEALHSLVINQLMLFGGEAVWLDGQNSCSTHTLMELSPSPSILQRIEAARAFTAEQHLSLIEDLPQYAGRETSLVVLPGFDYWYRQDDLLDGEGDRMLRRALDIVQREAERYEVPVLMTGTGDDLAAYADRTIECRATSQGIKFSSDTFDTLTYSGPGYIQTTLLFWEQVLEETYERIELQEAEVASEVMVAGQN